MFLKFTWKNAFQPRILLLANLLFKHNIIMTFLNIEELKFTFHTHFPRKLQERNIQKNQRIHQERKSLDLENNLSDSRKGKFQKDSCRTEPESNCLHLYHCTTNYPKTWCPESLLSVFLGLTDLCWTFFIQVQWLELESSQDLPGLFMQETFFMHMSAHQQRLFTSMSNELREYL